MQFSSELLNTWSPTISDNKQQWYKILDRLNSWLTTHGTTRLAQLLLVYVFSLAIALLFFLTFYLLSKVTTLNFLLNTLDLLLDLLITAILLFDELVFFWWMDFSFTAMVN